ncbi:MAG: carbonic anhydrase [Gemmatimonadales bacterium]
MRRLAYCIIAPLVLAGCGESPTTGPAFTRKGAVAPIGAGQSPIDIRADDATSVSRQEVSALKFRYDRRADLVVVNTGSPDEFATVRADVAPGDAELRTGDRVFHLLQFHWHTPAEHEIEGERGPLEMHLVHRAADGGLMVVGVLVREGAAHAELARIFDDLPEPPGAQEEIERFNLARLLPHDRESFRYHGSLTTPPFTEGVSWVVLAQPIEMSAAQIEAFRELFEEGNSREVQPLNGRTIISDAELAALASE